VLVLSRRPDEAILIGDDIQVIVVGVRGDQVRLGVTAPRDVPVHRKEVYEAIKRDGRAGSRPGPSGRPGP